MSDINKPNLVGGEVVQLSITSCENKAFAGCFMTVTEPKEWGAVGYIHGVGTREEVGLTYYYRAKWIEFDYIGLAIWDVQ